MNQCECVDRGCPEHLGVSICPERARMTLYRVDMDDKQGTPMCGGCSSDAFVSGVFTTEKGH